MKTHLLQLRHSLFFKISFFLFLGILLVQVGSFWFFFGERQNAVTAARGEGVFNRIVETVRLLESQSAIDRVSFIKKHHADDLRIEAISENEVFQNSP